MARPRAARAGGPAIPDKSFFKIGEVSTLLAVPASALRFWETEFARFVRPAKSRTGQRIYARRDVEALHAIRRLLKEQGFTIAGARKQLRHDLPAFDEAREVIEPPSGNPVAAPLAPPGERFARIRAEAEALLALAGAETSQDEPADEDGG